MRTAPGLAIGTIAGTIANKIANTSMVQLLFLAHNFIHSFLMYFSNCAASCHF